MDFCVITMKYTITINQLGLREDKKISLVEASIICWIHDFCGTNNKKINKNKVDGWTLVRGQYLVDDMPLLRIKSRSGGTRLLKRLASLGYIELKSEPRKLWLKTTEKMDSLWFEVGASGEQDEALETQLGASKQQTCSPQATYHNTNTNTNTNTNIQPEVVEETIKEERITLPKHRGKYPADRLLYLYSKLYYKTYEATYKPNFGRDKKILNDLLQNYTEMQVALMLCIYFDWHGMTGSDSKEYNFVTGATFPIGMFKTMINKFEVYSRNVLNTPFDDDTQLLDIVIKSVS